MNIYNATVTFTPGNFMDTQWGRKTSLGFDVPGFDKTQRIWIKEDQNQKLADHMQLDKGQQIQVARIDKGEKSYWEVVNLPKAELPPADDGLPFDEPQPGKPTARTGKSAKKEETEEERMARLEAKAREITGAINNGSRILAKCYYTVVAELDHEKEKILAGFESEEDRQAYGELFDMAQPSPAEIQSMAVSLFIHIDRAIKF